MPGCAPKPPVEPQARGRMPCQSNVDARPHAQNTAQEVLARRSDRRVSRLLDCKIELEVRSWAELANSKLFGESRSRNDGVTPNLFDSWNMEVDPLSSTECEFSPSEFPVQRAARRDLRTNANPNQPHLLQMAVVRDFTMVL